MFELACWRNYHSLATCVHLALQKANGFQIASLEETFKMAELPSVDSFLFILQKCRKEKNIAYARRLHAHICANGLEIHRAVGNYIVPMFVECGIISEAQQVFNRLFHRNEHSWTSLLLGYIERGQSQHALYLYQKMQDDGVHPSRYTLMALLKACARLKDVEKGREVHVEIIQNGLGKDLFVVSTLVHMYVKCGSLLEASEVLDKLAVRNVVSWNALIAGYAEHGLGQEVLKCFEQMKLEGVFPDAVTFVCILKACGSVQAIKKGREIHLQITQKGFGRDLFVGNALVDMYAKCGSISEAREVFEMLPVRDVVSWTALIAGYAERGLGKEALNCFEQMQEDGISPSAVTFVSILKACCSIGAIDMGRKIHAHIIQNGFEGDVFVGTTLVDMYAKCGSLSEARKVFNRLQVRNAVSWNALIAGYAKHGPGQEALKCFDQMQFEGITPDAVTFVCILKACGNIGAIEKGREIHAEIAQKGFERDPFIGSTLINMYAKCGSLSEGQEVFDKLPVRDVVSWNALLAGYAEHGPDEEVLKFFEQMQMEGVSPNAFTLVCIVRACGNMGDMDKCRKIHNKIKQLGFEDDLFIGNTLVGMYAKCGSLIEAQEVFDKLPVHDVVSWNALITGYAEHGHGQEALKRFGQMQLEGISPTAVTFVCILKACTNIRAIDKGREMHMEIMQNGFERNVFVGNNLVDMYAKCGSLSEAREAFEKLPVRDVVSWTALIAGYAEHGPGQEALKCFEQMQLEGILPDAVTYICSLKACGNIGALDKGQVIHSEIAKRGFEKDLFVGSTLVNMYAKCGSVAAACAVFKQLPVRNVVSWTALIAGYTDHGPAQEALRCFEEMQLESITPDTVTFACALRACGSISAIEKGREIHANTARKGLEKDVFIASTLVDMYAKCGALSEAWEVFDKLPVRNVVSWNAIINGYGMNHEDTMALQCFEDMKEQGVKPDATTFTCLLTACSHARLILKGQEYFKMMREEYGIIPIADHYTCMVDLFARAGHVYQAEKFLETIPSCPSVETWRALLNACKTCGEAEPAHRCFQQLVQMNPEDAYPYVLMANIYANAGRRDDAYRIEELRKLAGAKKKPANAVIEVGKKVHEFMVGNNESKEISAMLEILGSRMKKAGHLPNLDLILQPISDEEKEAALCEHTDKLAVAFGLLNTPRGQILRVTKNMRMCNNCHNANKVISRIERREIIVRDGYSVHRFQDGFCSCGVVG